MFSIANRKLFLFQAVVIVVAVFWIFSPAWHGERLWDDDMLVFKNAVVQDPFGLWKIWLEPHRLIDYFPFTVSAEWLEWQLWHVDTLGYHLTSVILHICSALLIWRLFSKLGLRLAWLGGLVFAVHPVVVESVAWMAELKNTLSLPPFLLAMCAFIDYENQGKRKDYFLALGLFLVAMLCKTTMIMFPVVILLYAWWKRDGVGTRDLKISGPFFVISAGLGLMTVWFLNHDSVSMGNIVLGGFFSRLALAGLSLAFYFSKCFFPIGLMTIYPKWAIDPFSPVQFLPWPILGGVIGWFWMKRASWGRHALLGLGFFLINLMPFIGFIAGSYMEFSWVMDHMLYIPLIGLIGLIVAGLGRLQERTSSLIRSFGIGIGAIITGLMAWESHGYAGLYLNPETLWTYTLQHNAEAWTAHNNLGNVLDEKGETLEAMKQYRQGLQINPKDYVAHYNLGNMLMKSDRAAEAMEQYKEALRINSKYDVAYYSVGNVLVKSGHFPEAIEQYEQALKCNPDYEDAHVNLGVALFQMHRIPEAIEHYEEALKINPNDAATQSNLGMALLQSGRISEAIERLRQALKINPDLPGVREKLEEALQPRAPAKN